MNGWACERARGESTNRGEPMKTRLATAALVMCCAAVATATTHAAPAGTPARFEGGWIDLTRDWGDAHACLIDQTAGISASRRRAIH